MSRSWKLGDLTGPRAPNQTKLKGEGSRSDLIALAAKALRSSLPADSEARLIWVPGRIEVAGKHTDYAGGRSLVVPTSQGIVMVVVPRSDRRILVVDAIEGSEFEFPLQAQPVAVQKSWHNYFATAACRLAGNFPGLSRGACISFASNLPIAAGLSSSSALIVGTFLALASVNRLMDRRDYRQAIPDLETLAGYLGAVENGYSYGTLTGTGGVGTFGGSEDHTAILCGQPGSLVQYSYSPVRFERAIALPEDFVFTVATSGIKAEKTGSARADYNRLSLQSVEVARLWREVTGSDLPDMGSILVADPDAASKFPDLLEQVEDTAFPKRHLSVRFEHFEQENQIIVPNSGTALAEGEIERFGEWIDRSMHLAESLLGNQVPETSFLAARARQLGAVAASAFGAGFGGAVWALVARDEAETFKYYFKESYLKAFPGHRRSATFFLTDAGPPAKEIVPEP